MARKNRNAGAAPLTSPQTREERYLANIAGLVNTKPAYPFTRTERYLDAISSNTSGIANRVTALETGKVNILGKGDNLLINAYFYRPVNQREIAADTWVDATDPATYNFIDRWQLTSGRAKLASAGVVLEGTMIQTLEFAPYGDVIASVLTSDGYLTPVYDSETKTFTITGTGETLVAAKLELGTVQTLYSGTTLLDAAPDYSVEMTKCQRYLHVIKAGSARNLMIGIGNANASNSVYWDMTIPIMAKTPSLSVEANKIGIGTNTFTLNAAVVSLFNYSAGHASVQAAGFSGLTPGQPYRIALLDGGTMIFSAE